MYTLLLQSAEDVAREIARLQHGYQFLSYGLIVAWLLLVGYVLMMVARERKLKREIESLKAMLESTSSGSRQSPSR
ncbi:MAG TPA: CcmD family protein [Candidatus Acidoferrales bacterium]|nr:CcmD family protein [Candidatus Acidoferrales bacterium]